MKIRSILITAALPIALVAILSLAHSRAAPVTEIPSPSFDPATAQDGLQTTVLAGGCFWGVQAVYQHLKGVTNAVSGYAGGAKKDAEYYTVGTGQTGHAESVAVTFDPRIVSFGKILQVYFSVAHDPTQLNRQGPDSGTQYRSEIFAQDDTQRKVSVGYIAQLNAEKVFPTPIVTKIAETKMEFYPAEDYHQDYATLHPNQPYIAYNDLPKVENLKRIFPDLYREKPVLVAEAKAKATN